MKHRMIKYLCVFLLSLPAGNVFSYGVLKQVELTSKNSKNLGFQVTEIDSGDSKVRLVVFKFPKNIHDDWVAKRVQTSLIDSAGHEVMGSSSDYEVSDEEPSILVHYQAKNHDVTISVQYLCKEGGGYGCAEAYTVNSVTNYLMTKKQPSLKRVSLT